MTPHLSRLAIVGAVAITGGCMAIGGRLADGSAVAAAASATQGAEPARSTPVPTASISPESCPDLSPAPGSSSPESPASSLYPDPARLASLSATPCPPPQIPAVSMGVGGQDLILGPGDTSGSFVVANAGEVVLSIGTSAYDFTLDADGNQVPAASPLPVGAAAWIVIEETEFELAPAESRTVTFSVTLPDDATPGDHYAALQVTGTMTDDATTQLQEARRAQLFMRSKVAFPLTTVVRVPGEVIPRIVVPPFEAFLPNLVLSSDGSVGFSPTIQNEGNVAAVWMPVAGKSSSLDTMIPTLKLEATGGILVQDASLFAGAVGANGDVNLSPLVVLPGATHTQRLTLNDAPLFGTYDYRYTLPGNEADGRETITTTGSFTVISLQKLFYWVVLPLLLLLLLVGLVTFRRRHIGNQRRMAAAFRARELQLARQEAYEQALREQQAAHGHPMR